MTPKAPMVRIKWINFNQTFSKRRKLFVKHFRFPFHCCRPAETAASHISNGTIEMAKEYFGQCIGIFIRHTHVRILSAKIFSYTGHSQQVTFFH